jgi:hypothetical protein
VRLLALSVDPVPDDRRAPLASRLDPRRPDHAAVVAAHERAMAADQDGYLDPTTGYFVFTAQALWERGECCWSGCRHCPFEDGPRVGAGPAGPSGSRSGQSRPGTE